ncbi:MAG TPA: CehA/McbA family metallohydrolase [Vicinamibacteria bacterium]|nr:CehA/McbA family metallohydrolase [Vicinamibacteria bacterium]
MTRRRRALLGCLAAVVAGWAWLASRGPLPVSGPPPDDGYVRVPGAVHVHTTLSDGGGTPAEVAAAARAAGLGFVAITDHNTVEAKPFEGVHDGVLTLVGTEISTTAGHVLALGVKDPAYRFSGDALDALHDVRDLGGTAFAAHPLSPRTDFLWTGWGLPGPWGMELWNGDSQWRAAGWGRLLRTAAVYLVNPRHALLGSLSPPGDALARWDRLLADRRVAGLLGADAHSRLPLSKRFAPRFPSYRALFELARNYAVLDAPLSGDARRDAEAIVTALARGRCYVGIDALASAAAFSFVATAGSERFTMGDAAPLEARPRLRVAARAPRGSRARLLRDGELVARSEPSGEAGLRLEAEADLPGCYRVEARVPGHELPWILSNPICVHDAKARADREARSSWPDDPPPPAPKAVLADPAAFVVEADPSSEAQHDVRVPGGGPRGGPAAKLAFRLGRPEPGRPFVWCALVNREPRDLSGARGLVLWVKADGEYRFWVQFRDENPAARDEGVEPWFASVRTSREWRAVAVPFARLRSIHPQTDGSFDAARVRALVFVVDHGAVKPGTAGTIWIAEPAVY